MDQCPPSERLLAMRDGAARFAVHPPKQEDSGHCLARNGTLRRVRLAETSSADHQSHQPADCLPLVQDHGKSRRVFAVVGHLVRCRPIDSTSLSNPIEFACSSKKWERRHTDRRSSSPFTATSKYTSYFCLAMIMSLILLYVACGMTFFFTKSVFLAYGRPSIIFCEYTEPMPGRASS
jgi:hypothetical protein